MHRHTPLAVGLVVAVLAACSEAPSDASPPANAATDEGVAAADALVAEAEASGIPPLSPAVGAVATPSAGASLDSLPFAAALAADTPYADARAAILGAGWRPIITPTCAENVGGEARICRELPELEACSGTGEGFCKLAFADSSGAQSLVVRTKGGHADWSARGENASMRIDGAELDALASEAEAACPAEDFNAFLAAFAADPAVRASWTAPLVRTALRYDPYPRRSRHDPLHHPRKRW